MAKPLESLSAQLRLWFFALALADLEQCVQAASSALDLGDHPLSDEKQIAYDAFVECAVVRYARPFSPSILPQDREAHAPAPPRLSTKLPAEFVITTLIPGADDVHSKVMNLRDRFYAHSDAQEKAVQFRIVEKDGAAFLKTYVVNARVQPSNLKLILRLAKALVDRIYGEIDLLARATLPYLEIGQMVTYEFIRGLDHE